MISAEVNAIPRVPHKRNMKQQNKKQRNKKEKFPIIGNRTQDNCPLTYRDNNSSANSAIGICSFYVIDKYVLIVP